MARRARWDFREVNVLLVVVLLALTGVMAAIGWWYRPGSSAYPTVGRRLALSVKADTRSLVLTMIRTRSGGAVLTLYDDDRFFAGPSAHGVTPGGWTVGIDGLGAGRVVRRPRGETVPIPAEQTPFDHDRMPIPRVHGGATRGLTDVGAVPEVTYAPDAADAPLYLQLRWASNPPVRLDGAYLSAQLPSVTVRWPGTAPASLPMATTLAPIAGDVGQFSVQATTGPITDARSWRWDLESAPTTASARGGQSSATFDPIAVSAVNVSRTQQESVRTFFIGVLLGIAGSAVLGVVLELVKIRRIRVDTDTAST